MHKKSVYIIGTRNSVVGMQEAVAKMSKLALKLLKSEELQSPETEGYISRGIRKNYLSEIRSRKSDKYAAQKNQRRRIQTEFKMPVFDKVKPLSPIEDLSKIKIALVTSGGIVPKGNPDHIESSSASRFGRYSLEGEKVTAHGGYDPTYANENPNRVLPIDVMRELEKKGSSANCMMFICNSGNGTSVANARKFGKRSPRNWRKKECKPFS